MIYYYIKYNQKINKINIIYLLCLYVISEYNIQTKMYDIIHFSSLKELSNRIYKYTGKQISKSTLSRLITQIQQNNSNYNEFIQVIENNTIKINNNIKECNSFVTIEKEIAYKIIAKNDNMLAKYALFLLYNCGKYKKIDYTAKQILEMLDYSIKSGSNISKISYYNSFLTENKIIQIKKYKDINNKERNIYTIFGYA